MWVGKTEQGSVSCEYVWFGINLSVVTCHEFHLVSFIFNAYYISYYFV